MKKILVIFTICGAVFSAPVFATEKEAIPETSTQIEDRAVPYEEVSLQSKTLREIWIDPNGSDSWWHLKDERRSTYIATFQNDLGQKVYISQWIDHYACAPTKCPVRVIVDGIKIFDDTICTDRSEHTLTPNRNSAFLCDFVIPLRTDVQEKAQ